MVSVIGESESVRRMVRVTGECASEGWYVKGKLGWQVKMICEGGRRMVRVIGEW